MSTDNANLFTPVVLRLGLCKRRRSTLYAIIWSNYVVGPIRLVHVRVPIPRICLGANMRCDSVVRVAVSIYATSPSDLIFKSARDVNKTEHRDASLDH